MGLLALNSKNRESNENYREFINDKKWDELVSLFQSEVFKIFSVPQTPLMEQTLQCGIAVLQTEFCRDKEFFN